MRRRALLVLVVAALAASCAGSKADESADGLRTTSPSALAVDDTDDDQTDDVEPTAGSTDPADRPARSGQAITVAVPDDAVDALAEVEQAFAELDAELAGLAETLDDIDALTALTALDRP